ncbi:ATP-binding cassette domain-containing protein [Oleiagrimonas sp.]|jgi:ATP-binding cassette subfamily F protein uup|uniref:ATP-binding cassette domain-containing protein n=1 Tax=Oleiagrimonas sp. TaxID=2010330 RepID=UPI002631B6FB|nr:ATP-binding cassette domain-containing protein [Oleiagrimonas sp.]MDA3913790.1 ATP-binding cassette domain-containing protein [Oleiagrimonas sp.]
MSLIQLLTVDYSVGGPLLLDSIDFTLETNERVCIVGRNGAGKSTLLRLLDGAITPDDGEIRRQGGLRVARLTQEVPQQDHGSVFDVVAAGLGDLGAHLAAFHHAAHEGDMQAMAHAQERIEAGHGWDLDTRVTQTLSRLGLDGDAGFVALSGGMKRRVLLAQALVCAPDVLLLDEPTNHLDIEAIDWLQEFLRGFGGSIVFVTHDRRFLRELATRIVEIDRGRLTDWPGDYDNYLRRREERAHAEAQAHAAFDKKLAQEEAWIRQGIKARRTRNEGRVRALKALRNERAERREKTGTAKMQLADAQASGRKVLEAREIGFNYGERVLVKDFSTTVMRGDRIGIIGPNGAGKTTLIRLLLGQTPPDSGSVKVGQGLEVAYFDQHRAALDDRLNAADNVAEGREFIELNGKRTHIMGYLQDFLFAPDRARAPITRLSGGERNRLLLAKLFAKPSNLLVMDEPTNDLDVETLELLEDLLADYSGTLLLVSHDREFLDNVVTSTLVLEGEGRIGEYIGGYQDWLRQRRDTQTWGGPAATPASAGKPPPAAAPSPVPAPPERRKRNYKDQRELDQLPARIEKLETDIAARTVAMNAPDFFQQDSDAIVAANEKLAALQAELETAYARWAELEA